MSYLCTATRTWKEESSTSCSLYSRSSIHNITASDEAQLYERMAAFRIKHERVEGQFNPDDPSNAVLDYEAVGVSFGPIHRIAASSVCMAEKLQATNTWKEHEQAMAERADRQRERRAMEAEKRLQREQEAADGDMAAYLRVKARLEAGDVVS